MSWLHYLMEANLYLVLFYLCYCLFLNRETHYTLNRAYLLFSCVAAFVLPMLQLGMLKPGPQSITPVNYVVTTTVPLAHTSVTLAAPVTVNPVFTWDDGLVYMYVVGAGILLLVLLFKLYRLARLARAGMAGEAQGYRLVRLNEANTAFSFFKYLFIGTGAVSADTIIRHELVHIKQKHSADIVFIELLKVINWFNPAIYLMQRSLRAVHEYIADEQTASSGNGALAYSSFLVENAYGLSGTSVTHSFFNYNLLKKRIIMLHQKRSGKLARLKYLLAVPVFAALLCASTLAFSKNYAWFDLAPKKIPAERPALRKASALKVTVNISHSNTSKPVQNKVTDTGHRTSTVYISQKGRTKTSKKGFKYQETGYLVDGKTDYRVIITDANGEQKEYWKSKASAAEITMLREKYGYTFPAMALYAKMPPPPPVPPAPKDDRLPPPPPAPPVGDHKAPPPPPVPPVGDHKAPPPPPVPPAPPAGVQPPPPPPAPPVGNGSAKATGAKVLTMTIDSDAFTRSDLKGDHTPVIVVNGSIYKLKEPLKKGQELIVDAKGGAHATMYTDNDLQDAIKKYGENAKNGVIYAYGETSVQVR